MQKIAKIKKDRDFFQYKRGLLRTLAFSLSQNITVVKDKLSCSTEHFIGLRTTKQNCPYIVAQLN